MKVETPTPAPIRSYLHVGGTGLSSNWHSGHCRDPDFPETMTANQPKSLDVSSQAGRLDDMIAWILSLEKLFHY